ncbi:MAG: NAD(P)/FAD-dependent oxidoreductase, partial [Phycisphaerae bacterium]|nr:NAD(P)/FAD-dependent oxidoreductase [Phycisphaerae bacterium]
MTFDVIVVGAGAAGLTAGIFAAQRLGPYHPPTMPRIAVVDGAKHPGAKILVAGGGRCNVTNARVKPTDYNGTSRNTIRNVLSAFDVASTVAWFADMGVAMHEEEFGKIFPDSNQARTVLNALLARLESRGVTLLTEHRVTKIERDCASRNDNNNDTGGFIITTNNGVIRAGRVILATGGLSLPKTGSDGVGYELARNLGHSIVPTTPGL